jgi:tetratricopeptide (TPR) repeat protein
LLAITTTLVLTGIGAGAEAQNSPGLSEARGLAMSGRKLTDQDAEALEKQLVDQPNDVGARTKLLGYYFGKQFQNRPAREAKQKHVLWLIENAPASEVLGMPEGSLDAILDPDAYSQGKKAWLDQLKKEPANLKLLDHSAAFFLIHDRNLAIQSLQAAGALDRENPRWPERLGHLYSLEMNRHSAKERTDAAAKALEHYEIAYKLSTDRGRDPLLKGLAKAALAAGRLDKAREYAEKMLSQNGSGWNSGNNIHHGNLILGEIALTANRLDEAKDRLIKAGQTPGSPQLNSFGPNMTLAKDLLERHENDVVLEYFALCAKFWKLDRGRLEKWSADVKAGRIPDFGGNLNY